MATNCKWCPEKDCSDDFIARCKRKGQLDFYQRYFRVFKSPVTTKTEFENMDELVEVIRANKEYLPKEAKR